MVRPITPSTPEKMCIRDSLKAEAVMKASGLPVLADDSGLMVDSLDGAPGVYSARYGHKNSDAERIDYLLANLKDVPAGSRAAKFVCVITCLWPDGRKIVARGECPGEILFAPQGTGGFGYLSLIHICHARAQSCDQDAGAARRPRRDLRL